VGEDTTPADAQSLNTVSGKILRIDREGTIPADNPFFKSTSGNRRVIWALGLRQPYSLDVQSGTGSLMDPSNASLLDEILEEYDFGLIPR
jgi:glucose/arabinose dehydrogenase